MRLSLRTGASDDDKITVEHIEGEPKPRFSNKPVWLLLEEALARLLTEHDTVIITRLDNGK